MWLVLKKEKHNYSNSCLVHMYKHGFIYVCISIYLLIWGGGGRPKSRHPHMKIPQAKDLHELSISTLRGARHGGATLTRQPGRPLVRKVLLVGVLLGEIDGPGR